MNFGVNASISFRTVTSDIAVRLKYAPYRAFNSIDRTGLRYALRVKRNGDDCHFPNSARCFLIIAYPAAEKCRLSV